MVVYRIAGILILVGFLAGGDVQAQADSRPLQPLFERYLACYNSNDVDTLRAFVQQSFRLPETNAGPAIERRIGNTRAVWYRYGPVEIEEFTLSAETRIEAWVRGTLTGAHSMFYIGVDENGRIKSTATTSGMRPHRDHDALASLSATSLDAALHPYLMSLESQGLFSGTVYVGNESGVLFERAYGLMDSRAPTRNSKETLFHLQSVSKMMTGAIILSLVSDGHLELEDPIGRFIPEYPAPWAQRVTVRHLLTHTSGIELDGDRSFLEQAAAAQSTEELVQAQIDHIAVLGDFDDTHLGKKFDYSNEGFALLGLIAERAAERSFPALLRERIFQPADLQNTLSLDANQWGRSVAVGHTTRLDFWEERVASVLLPVPETIQKPRIHARMPDPAASCLASARDSAVFLQRLMAGDIITSRMVTAMTQRNVVKFEDDELDVAEFYGLGMNIYEDQGNVRMGHTGGGPGFAAFVFWYPAQRVVTAVLTNSEAAGRAVDMRIHDLIVPRSR
jgi:CubicO group peptidase (beta-lactamase class C family)